MINKLIVFAVAIMLTTNNYAANLNLDCTIISSFKEKLKNSKNVICSTKENYIKVKIDLDGENKLVYFDLAGNLIGESKKFDLNKLPKNGLDFILKTYPFPEYDLIDCIEFIDGFGQKHFFVAFEKQSELVTIKINVNGSVNEI